VPAGLVDDAQALCASLAVFDPALLSGADCGVVVEVLSKTEKACAAARARAAARAVANGEHRARGFADGADWMAARAGSSVSESRLELETAKAVEGLPATASALAGGQVSLAQAAEVARAEAESPGSEAALLELAKRAGLGPVREQARNLVLAAADAGALAKKRHEARQFRQWHDGLGMVRFAVALPPEEGVPIANRVEAEANRLRRGAKGAKERFEAYAADAFVAMLNGQGQAPGRADVVYVCDVNASRRGHAHGGEPCHIIDGGPVTVASVDQAAGDAFIKAVLHDGVDIIAVKHFGRHMSAELRTALGLGKPPGLGGAKCSEPGCERRYGLEWDHVEPFANNGPTSYDNLQALCKPHHWEKTERDRQAGLLGPRAP
jgi:hypothetical protein